jgi:hypothetical protein
MAQSPRKLHFVVGTSLMTAALLTPSLGCSKKRTVNERPPDDLHINEGPQPDPDSADAGSVEPDQPEPPPEEPDNVNVGPQDEPEPEKPLSTDI